MNSLSSTPAADAVIVNPRSGALARAPHLLRQIRQLTEQAGPSCTAIVTADQAELETAAREILSRPHRLVAICGGDGTYHAVATAFFRADPRGHYPPLALVRTGTVCTVARNWGSPRAVLPGLRDLLDRRRPLILTPRPTLRIDDGEAPRVGFIFGAGLVSGFFDEYEARGAGGNRTALAIAGRVFVEALVGGPLAQRVLSPLPCRVTVDGEPLPSSAFSLIVTAVVKDLGLHLHVTHRAGEDPRRPHLVASALPPRTLAPQWPLVVLGKRLLGEGGFDGLFGSLTVEFPGRGAYVLDGDTLRASRVTVSAGPELRIATATAPGG
jgi:diacylglycerol kinase family enzyme